METARIRLVAGLGNPGAEYERTRHNVGFMVLDQLAADWRVAWERSAKWGAYWAKADSVLLVKPMTYMNRSGGPLAAVAQFYKIEPADILPVFDDLALPLGRLRIRLGGSGGGHNGMDSIITTLGTDEIPRLRVGIGAAPREGAVDYVLGRFFEEEMPLVTKSVARAAEAVKCAIDKGVVSAMNTFNKFPEA
ncbi:MAG TPA: aminoacyl-tRNA hydrolase [Chthoniobacterales bacterium]